MIPKEFFNNATGDDLRFLRRWAWRVCVVYCALAIALFGFAIHERSSTIAEGAAPDASPVISARQ